MRRVLGLVDLEGVGERGLAAPEHRDVAPTGCRPPTGPSVIGSHDVVPASHSVALVKVAQVVAHHGQRSGAVDGARDGRHVDVYPFRSASMAGLPSRM